MADPIRVLIADDHLIVREGLSLILETAPDVELVGEASNGAEAVEMALEKQPDVILMDLSMPVMDGIDAIGRLQADLPEAAIVILTTYDDDNLIMRGLRAGARAYLLKDTDRLTLLETIRAAARGETLLKPDILAHLIEQTTPSPPTGVELTERELEVLHAAARGERSKEIALQLAITERTVKAHLTSIYNKLGVDSRAAAVAAAAGLGLLDSGDK
ncbi:MAG: response regulator transcription factor [Anaerolineae bacterium]|nr:response regulator transcription factor [Anaerolineae bacterium]